jgi:hypothetical protein
LPGAYDGRSTLPILSAWLILLAQQDRLVWGTSPHRVIQADDILSDGCRELRWEIAPPPLSLVDEIEVETVEHIAIGLRFPDLIKALGLFMTES